MGAQRLSALRSAPCTGDSGTVSMDQAIEGLANPSVVTVAAVLVLSGG